MKFKNYCIIIIGNTDGVFLEIAKIAEAKPNVLDGKGLYIATFTSACTVGEIQDLFIDYGRNFLVFDLNPVSSGFHITKTHIHDGLFGFLKTLGGDDMKTRADELIRQINLTSETKSDIHSVGIKKVVPNPKEIKPKKITDKDLAEMSKKDKEDLFNKLFSNIENLSEYDKKLLEKLAI